MDVVVAGGHGRIGLRLLRLLAERGDRARGIIRSPEHVDDLRVAGAEAVVCDLESSDPVVPVIAGADAVVFAAGAGAGSGAERKRTMDLGGALKLIAGARPAGVRRFVMVSAMGAAEPPAEGGGVFGDYLRAKGEADRALASSRLDYTIVRPGGLTDEPGTGRVQVGERLARGQIPREDVAATLLAVLHSPATVGRTFDLVAGEAPIAEALTGLGGGEGG